MNLSHDEGHFLVIDGRNMNAVLDIPPSKRRVRANRTKLRKLLLTGLDVVYEKQCSAYEILEDGVLAKFTDGSTAKGTLLVGCDGNNSAIRRQLVGAEKAALHAVGVTCDGVVQRYSKEKAKPFRDIDPLLFQSINPATRNYIWHSIQSIDDDGENLELLTMVSHPVSSDPQEELPKGATCKDIIAGTSR